MAEREGLSIAKIYKESESAAEPNIRPKFRRMIQEVEDGKYQGIISWKPDRLARNMREAGEIIDLLDKGIIKDLRFASFAFDNSTAGKTLLGIAFVMSKQYSDTLSDNVLRGNRLSIEEGKYINSPKHGYKKDVNQRLRPDGENFVIIKEAFAMRLEGRTIADAVKHVNDRGYQKYYSNHAKASSRHKSFEMTKQVLSKIFRDPVYAGVVTYGKQVVNLNEVYDFIPMITPDQFLQINKLKNMGQALKLVAQRQRGGSQAVRADLMRGMVFCASCGEGMYAGITSKPGDGKKKEYFYYRCHAEGCEYKNKSVRAKVIIDFAIELLGGISIANKEMYDLYKSQMKDLTKKKVAEAESLLKSKLQVVGKLKKRIKDTKELLLEEEDREIKEDFKGDLKRYKEELSVAEGEVQQLKEYKKDNSSVILTYAEFLELFQNIPEIIRNCSEMKQLDQIMRIVFSNFHVKRKKVVEYKLKPPFSGLVEAVDSTAISDCRGGGI